MKKTLTRMLSQGVSRKVTLCSCGTKRSRKLVNMVSSKGFGGDLKKLKILKVIILSILDSERLTFSMNGKFMKMFYDGNI